MTSPFIKDHVDCRARIMSVSLKREREFVDWLTSLNLMIFMRMIFICVSFLNHPWQRAENINIPFSIRLSYMNCLLTYALLIPEAATSRKLRSHGHIMYEIPRTHSVFGKRAFNVFAPTSGSNLKGHLKPERCISLNYFKSKMKEYLVNVCTCF